jgi:amino acid transporter
VSDEGMTIAPTALSDEERLHQMGYAQELNRSMSKFSNFAISFTIISILSGCLTLYGYGLAHGGPPTMIWGWVIVGGLVMFAGLSMAEICSAYPTAGGLYYWAAKLAPGKSGPIWSWFAGWFNLMGQVAVTAGITFGCGYSVAAFLQLFTSQTYWTSSGHVVAITGGLLFLQGVINTFGVNIVSLFNKVSVWWHLGGVTVIVVLLFIAPSSHEHQSASFIFGSAGWHAFSGMSGFSAPFYVFLLGLLVAQYTFTGYDASAHVTEETKDAAISGPKGIVTSIWVSWAAGFVLLVGVSAAIPHIFPFSVAGTSYTGYSSIPFSFTGAGGAAGAPWVLIFEHATGRVLGELLVLVVIVAQFLCGIASVTANSRMIYAFSRDGAVPFSSYWHKVSKRSHVPVHSAWFGVVGAFLLAATAMKSSVAYFAVTSIAVIGLYVAYLIPVFLRRINGKAFVPGPWKLGKWGPFFGWVAIVWVAFICILFSLPQYTPKAAGSDLLAFNFTPVAVIVVIGFAGIWYAVSARKWFKGPKIQGTPEELAAIEHELSI